MPVLAELKFKRGCRSSTRASCKHGSWGSGHTPAADPGDGSGLRGPPQVLEDDLLCGLGETDERVDGTALQLWTWRQDPECLEGNDRPPHSQWKETEAQPQNNKVLGMLSAYSKPGAVLSPLTHVLPFNPSNNRHRGKLIPGPLLYKWGKEDSGR